MPKLRLVIYKGEVANYRYLVHGAIRQSLQKSSITHGCFRDSRHQERPEFFAALGTVSCQSQSDEPEALKARRAAP
jgi:hypothetical protein